MRDTIIHVWEFSRPIVCLTIWLKNYLKNLFSVWSLDFTNNNKKKTTVPIPLTNKPNKQKNQKNQKGILWLAAAVPPCIHHPLCGLSKFYPLFLFPPFLSSACTGHQQCFNSNQVVSNWHSGSSGFVPASLNLQNRYIIPAWVHCHWLFWEGMSVKCPEEPYAVWHRSTSCCRDAEEERCPLWESSEPGKLPWKQPTKCRKGACRTGSSPLLLQSWNHHTLPAAVSCLAAIPRLGPAGWGLQTVLVTVWLGQGGTAPPRCILHLMPCWMWGWLGWLYSECPSNAAWTCR